MSTWLDLKNNPRLKKIYQTRCQLIQLTRDFFWSRGFTETDTPLAVRYPGQEPYLNPVPLALHNERGAAQNFYLHTSPEYSLKKLLAAGFGKIFEITKTFRDYESFGGNHNPEFTMLEWYRMPGSYHDFINDTEELFKHVGVKLEIEAVKYGNREIKINLPWERLSMKEAWRQHVGVDLDEYLEIDKLRNLANELDYQFEFDAAYEDIFFKIFLNKIEPRLGLERPVFVYDYPLALCSLSRPSELDPRYGERAELYIGGLEIANGFGELTDAVEQRRRLEADRALRQKLGKSSWPVDEDFIAALGSGFPSPAAGIALGVDRMVVLFTGAKDLNEVMFQSIRDQIGE